MTTLRPYQNQFISSIRQRLSAHPHILACAATGSGKSKVFISIAHSALARDRTVLILSESRKIFTQISDETEAVEIAAGSDLSYIAPGKLYLAMAQTLSRRKALVTQFAALGQQLLIINDEAHIGTATKLLLQLPAAFLIGFTATPDFRVAKHLPKLYQSLVLGPQPEELVANGWLAPYRHFARVSANLSQLILKGGEFTEESQEKVFESPKVYEGVEEDLSTLRYKKCLIFTSSIRHCEALYSKLTDAGHHLVRVHSKLPDAACSYDLARFTKGEVRICVSVGILTKGFDMPAIDLVMLNRATPSLALYLQMIGRASRIDEGKGGFTVVDYGGNYSRHGLWDGERDWENMWNKMPKRKQAGSAPVKYCGKCEYICHSSATVCPNCGAPFPITEQMAAESKLVEITGEYDKLRGRRVSSLTPEQLAIYAKLKNKGVFATRIAKSRDQHLPGFLASFAKCMGYRNGWLYHQQLQTRPGEVILFTDVVLR